MNFVFLSPHFPSNFFNFCVRLRERGVNVLSMSENSFDSFRPELRNSISEYYQVQSMHDYGQLIRAIGWFTHKHGKMDRIESHNEYWLETEAALRTDFNVYGIQSEHIAAMKHKSAMKKKFQDAGLRVARGEVCRSEEEIRALIKEVGYPVVAKPDIGVGAAATYKICDEAQLQSYLKEKPPIDYIVEEYIDAPIFTFDGLVDRDGHPVFLSSLQYNRGIMDVVNEDTDVYYYFSREMDLKLKEAGMATLRAFDVRERFFHFEYFKMPDGDVIPMEVNMRPPGGLTLDMFNYANDFDCYALWADIVAHGRCAPQPPPKYYVIYISRKDRIHYAMPFHEVLEQYSDLIAQEERMPDVVSRALGNHGFVLRATELPTLIAAADAIQKRA